MTGPTSLSKKTKLYVLREAGHTVSKALCTTNLRQTAHSSLYNAHSTRCLSQSSASARGASEAPYP